MLYSTWGQTAAVFRNYIGSIDKRSDRGALSIADSRRRGRDCYGTLTRISSYFSQSAVVDFVLRVSGRG